MDRLVVAAAARDWAFILVLGAAGVAIAIGRARGASWSRHRALLGTAFVSLSWLVLFAVAVFVIAGLESDSFSQLAALLVAALAAWGAIVTRLEFLGKDTSRWLLGRRRRASSSVQPAAPSETAAPAKPSPSAFGLYDDIVVATDRFEQVGVRRGTSGVVFGIGYDGTYEIAVAGAGDGEPTRFTAGHDDLAPDASGEGASESERDRS